MYHDENIGYHKCVFCIYRRNRETAFAMNMTDNLEEIKNEGLLRLPHVAIMMSQ